MMAGCARPKPRKCIELPGSGWYNGDYTQGDEFERR
jgi:hypothetical protein